jgi:hypothetical protein
MVSRFFGGGTESLREKGIEQNTGPHYHLAGPQELKRRLPCVSFQNAGEEMVLVCRKQQLG